MEVNSGMDWQIELGYNGCLTCGRHTVYQLSEKVFEWLIDDEPIDRFETLQAALMAANERAIKGELTCKD